MIDMTPSSQDTPLFIVRFHDTHQHASLQDWEHTPLQIWKHTHHCKTPSELSTLIINSYTTIQYTSSIHHLNVLFIPSQHIISIYTISPCPLNKPFIFLSSFFSFFLPSFFCLFFCLSVIVLCNRKYYTVFDMEKSQVGFALANRTPPTPASP